VVPGETVSVDRPDILIVEGLNVLLPNRLQKTGKPIPFVSDFLISLFILTRMRLILSVGMSIVSCD